MKLFYGSNVTCFYFNPVLVLSRKCKVIAVVWLKFKIGLLY